MPTYEFKCNRCGEEFEVFTSISEKDKVECSKCKSSDITQFFSSFYMRGDSGSSCESCKAATCNTCPLKKPRLHRDFQ